MLDVGVCVGGREVANLTVRNCWRVSILQQACKAPTVCARVVPGQGFKVNLASNLPLTTASLEAHFAFKAKTSSLA